MEEKKYCSLSFDWKKENIAILTTKKKRKTDCSADDPSSMKGRQATDARYSSSRGGASHWLEGP